MTTIGPVRSLASAPAWVRCWGRFENWQSRSPPDDPRLLRADIAAITEQWSADPTLTWIGLCKKTTMAEGDIYRLLARTLEFLSQLHTLKDTHHALADCASQAIAILRRGVLEELP